MGTLGITFVDSVQMLLVFHEICIDKLLLLRCKAHSATSLLTKMSSMRFESIVSFGLDVVHDWELLYAADCSSYAF
jgi:hypothetical protein